MTDERKPVRDAPKTEDLVRAYDEADEKTKKVVRSLVKGGHGQEAHVVSEILHYFPGSHVER